MASQPQPDPLDVRPLQLSTITISVNVVKLAGHKMNLNTYRQLPDYPLLDPTETVVLGTPPGRVNYFWNGCHPNTVDKSHLHFLWIRDGEPCRAAVYYTRSANPTVRAEEDQRRALEAAMDALATLYFGILAYVDDWRPREAPGISKYQPLSLRWLAYRPVMTWAHVTASGGSRPSTLAVYLNLAMKGTTNGLPPGPGEAKRDPDADDLADLGRYLADAVLSQRAAFAWPPGVPQVLPQDVSDDDPRLADRDLDRLALALDQFLPELRDALIANDVERGEGLAESRRRDEFWTRAVDQRAAARQIFIGV